MKRTAIAMVRLAQREVPVGSARTEPEGPGAVEALRRRLAGSTAREHVVLDFLEDDLREARSALAAAAAYLANVEGALEDVTPSSERLLDLARAVDPAEQVDYLQTVLASVKRRLSQVAARM